MTLRARTDHVIIQIVTRTEAVRGGIILPDVAVEKPQRGVVIATGPDCTELAAGETVVFEKYTGVLFRHAGMELLTLPEGEVLGVVDPAAEVWVKLDAVTANRERWRLS